MGLFYYYGHKPENELHTNKYMQFTQISFSVSSLAQFAQPRQCAVGSQLFPIYLLLTILVLPALCIRAHILNNTLPVFPVDMLPKLGLNCFRFQFLCAAAYGRLVQEGRVAPVGWLHITREPPKYTLLVS